MIRPRQVGGAFNGWHRGNFYEITYDAMIFPIETRPAGVEGVIVMIRFRIIQKERAGWNSI